MNRAFSTGDFALREFLRRRLTAPPLGYITPITPSARFLFASGAISALTSRRDQIMLGAVSASEIIRELPKLTEAERRAIRVGLLEIANQDPDVALSNQSALEGALMLDRLENDDARHQSG